MTLLLSDRPVRLPVQVLPADGSITFGDSSFFTQGRACSLPPPAEVRAAAELANTSHRNPRRPFPVRFPSLNLVVKYGREITIAEGQCLWAIRRLLADIVPVPEVYGWCQDDSEVFIYMQMVRGATLEERWGTLRSEERVDICEQLHRMVGALRQLEQDPEDRFIGHIGRQPLLDVIFTSSCSPPAGPFPSTSSFHDWFTHLPRPHDHAPGDPPHPFRSNLPDNMPITFTHGDLHRSNIVVSLEGEGAPRVLAIIDWHQSGWLPAYWEFCKARWTTNIGEEWETEYLPKFLEPYKHYDYWDYFVLKIGV